MATVSSHRSITALVLVSLLVAAPLMASAITCSQVGGYLAPCSGYVVKGGSVPGNCCSGIRSLNSAARTTADRQTACSCLKSITGKIKGLNPSLAAKLPGSCGVSIPYPISSSTDCSKVR